jgi:hypothetical protein
MSGNPPRLKYKAWPRVAQRVASKNVSCAARTGSSIGTRRTLLCCEDSGSNGNSRRTIRPRSGSPSAPCHRSEPSRRPTKLDIDVWIAGELQFDAHHDYLSGEVWAKVGASDAHNILALNLGKALHTHLQGVPQPPRPISRPPP